MISSVSEKLIALYPFLVYLSLVLSNHSEAFGNILNRSYLEMLSSDPVFQWSNLEG